MKLLDLFCGEGGAAKGYADVGFDVTGVDIVPQPNYPFKFVQADALSFLCVKHEQYDAFHASPPCQAHSLLKTLHAVTHKDFIPRTRALLKRLAGKRPYIIENVETAPLNKPVLLCGTMVGIRTYRHRLFESNVLLKQPHHQPHRNPTAELGYEQAWHQYGQFVGNFIGIDTARVVMEMPWASQHGIAQAVPPAYTRLLGSQLL